MTNVLKDIPPENISHNPENPRMYFRETGLNRLAESIEEAGGVLVPIYVYEDPEKEGHYRLIDGERRWRVATRLGLETIPALVRDDPPDQAKNIVEMFNIHKVREDWEEMPTARALKEVMERNKTEDPDELKALTGLSKEQISRYKLILDLPERYQHFIEEGLIPMNFFVELDRNVIRPLARRRPLLAEDFNAEALRQAFVEKREHGALEDLIDLRKIKPIIERAAEEAGDPEQPSDLDGFLVTLFREPEVTIDEVYDASVAFSVEADKLSQQVANFMRQFERLLSSASTAEECESLLRTAAETRDGLTQMIEQYTPTSA